MPQSREFARQSLELHLFFGRIMKEHSFFLELGFTPRDSQYTQQADIFRNEFDRLLWEVVALSDGIVSPDVMNSGEVVTPYTLNAEMVSTYYTGVNIPNELTRAEIGLFENDQRSLSRDLDEKVFMINQRAIDLISSLIKFKTAILKNVLSCKMFTVNYPHMIDHILREAKLYLAMVQQLQSGEDFDMRNQELEQETFWNHIMGDHAKFIRGLLDPTEDDLITTANNFGNIFDQLTADANAAMDNSFPTDQLTADSLAATTELRNFKAQGTEGIIECKIKSIIIPLLADHTLREANHYLRLLNMFAG
jgi:hypothetical protein